MLNKNANCNNITIFRTFSVHIWQLKCQKWQPSKTKNGKLFFANFSKLSNFSSLSFWEKPFWNQKLLLLTGIARRSCYTHLFQRWVVFHFFTNFFGTNFHHQNKNNVVETISCFVDQLSKKYCVCYVFEHLKYCSQINEYWLNRNVGMNIVLGNFFVYL